MYVREPEPRIKQPEILSVAIGCWKVAAAPLRLQTLVGSCVGVIFYDRIGKLGGLAHIVLPKAHGVVDHPGKYADTAIPALLSDFNRQLGEQARIKVVAKLIGGANMFGVDLERPGHASLNIGQRNHEAIEQILSNLSIPVTARDIGGTTGRRMTLDTMTGVVTIKLPGGVEYEV